MQPSVASVLASSQVSPGSTVPLPQVDTQAPLALQLRLLPQVPQVPPQPSLPHCLPLQLGTQAH
jgi:hypothetical protein